MGHTVSHGRRLIQLRFSYKQIAVVVDGMINPVLAGSPGLDEVAFAGETLPGRLLNRWIHCVVEIVRAVDVDTALATLEEGAGYCSGRTVSFFSTHDTWFLGHG